MRTPLFGIMGPLIMLFCVCSGTAASACIDLVPFEIKDIRQADAIFSGKLVHYERVSRSRPDSLDAYALLTIRVEKVIKGRVPQMVQLYWWNSTFSIPKTIETENSLLIAAVSANRRILPIRGGSATVYPTRRPDLLQLMQAPCSIPFLLDDTGQNVANVRLILQGQPAEPHDYFAVRRGESERRSQAQKDHKAEIKKLIILLGSAIAATLTIALFFGWSRKRT